MNGYRGREAGDHDTERKGCALRLMEALSGVDEDLLERCEGEDRICLRPMRQIWRAAAAVLCLAVVGAAGWGGYRLAHVADSSSGGDGAQSIRVDEGAEEMAAGGGIEEDMCGVQGIPEGKQEEGAGVRSPEEGGTDSGGLQISDTRGQDAVTEAGKGMEESESLPEDEEACLELQHQKLTEEEARAMSLVGNYVPTALPEGYVFEEARSMMDTEEENLTLCWSRGMDYIMLSVEKREELPDTMDVARRECYDERLYQIPYGETVPEEYRDSFNDPVFAVEDLSLEVIESRMKSYDDSGDTDTPRGNFCVLYPDGVLVRFSGRGTAEEIWAMFRSMEE